MKRMLFYTECYGFNMPASFFHEACHWVWYFALYLLGLNSLPRIRVSRWYSIRDNGDGTCHQTMMYTYVWMGTSWYGDASVVNKVGLAMPVVGLALLVLLSPWQLDFYYLSQINTLWMSHSDIDKFFKKKSENEK